MKKALILAIVFCATQAMAQQLDSATNVLLQARFLEAHFPGVTAEKVLSGKEVKAIKKRQTHDVYEGYRTALQTNGTVMLAADTAITLDRGDVVYTYDGKPFMVQGTLTKPTMLIWNTGMNADEYVKHNSQQRALQYAQQGASPSYARTASTNKRAEMVQTNSSNTATSGYYAANQFPSDGESSYAANRQSNSGQTIAAIGQVLQFGFQTFMQIQYLKSGYGYGYGNYLGIQNPIYTGPGYMPNPNTDIIRSPSIYIAQISKNPWGQ